MHSFGAQAVWKTRIAWTKMTGLLLAFPLVDLFEPLSARFQPASEVNAGGAGHFNISIHTNLLRPASITLT